MREINIKFEKERMEESIDYLFFQGDARGKKIDGRTISISKEDSTIYTMLEDMDDYQVRVQNEILDGTMKFKIKTNKESIVMTPTNEFCIFRKKRFSFY